MNAAIAVSVAPVNGTLRKKRRSSSGSGARRSCATNPMIEAAARIADTCTRVEPHPASPASMIE